MAATDGSGTVPSGGGTSVEVDIDALATLGQSTSQAAADVAVAKQKLEAARGEQAMYSQYPAAQALAGHHDTVVDVFISTLTALEQEIDELGAVMVNAAHSYRDSDDAATATLAAIASRLTGTGYTQQAYDDARQDAGQDLTDPDAIDVDVDEAQSANPLLPSEAVEHLGGTPNPGGGAAVGATDGATIGRNDFT